MVIVVVILRCLQAIDDFFSLHHFSFLVVYINNDLPCSNAYGIKSL
jgi:hypothetical protein